MRSFIDSLRARLRIFEGIEEVLGEEASEQVKVAARNLRKRIVLEQDREALANAGLAVFKAD